MSYGANGRRNGIHNRNTTGKQCPLWAYAGMALSASVKVAHSNMLQVQVAQNAKIKARARVQVKEKERAKGRAEAQGNASRLDALQMHTGITISVPNATRNTFQIVDAYAKTTNGILSTVLPEMHVLSMLEVRVMRRIKRVPSLLWIICSSKSMIKASLRMICTALLKHCYLRIKECLIMQLMRARGRLAQPAH